MTQQVAAPTRWAAYVRYGDPGVFRVDEAPRPKPMSTMLTPGWPRDRRRARAPGTAL